ncbi:MAG: hypothetical protein C4525_03215 [Desulfarculus sp.]|jgi:hypothetical protein|nr:MAG: hypothetical protein C4525_03215 [Desulfarculus sp.]
MHAYFFIQPDGQIVSRVVYQEPPAEVPTPEGLLAFATTEATLLDAPFEALAVSIGGGQVQAVALKPRVIFTPDKWVIVAADPPVDKAVVGVRVEGADPMPPAIAVDVNGLEETVALTEGVGSLEVYARQACNPQISVVDAAAYYDGGGITLTAEAAGA